jgi:hypothetical protein
MLLHLRYISEATFAIELFSQLSHQESNLDELINSQPHCRCAMGEGRFRPTNTLWIEVKPGPERYARIELA